MAKIMTRIFNYGNKNEATWPPAFGTANGQGFSGYWDKEVQKFIEGRPPVRKTFDKAPYVIQDTLSEPYYHPAAQVLVETRSSLRAADLACGTITTDRMQPADSGRVKERRYQEKIDRHEALHKAVAQIDSGTAPMTEETRELCKLQNEIVANALPGLDPFNAAGRKKNPRGKRYRKN